eukprot:7378646-Prymnesium_polylepis.1
MRRDRLEVEGRLDIDEPHLCRRDGGKNTAADTVRDSEGTLGGSDVWSGTLGLGRKGSAVRSRCANLHWLAEQRLELGQRCEQCFRVFGAANADNLEAVEHRREVDFGGQRHLSIAYVFGRWVALRRVRAAVRAAIERAHEAQTAVTVLVLRRPRGERRCAGDGTAGALGFVALGRLSAVVACKVRRAFGVLWGPRFSIEIAAPGGLEADSALLVGKACGAAASAAVEARCIHSTVALSQRTHLQLRALPRGEIFRALPDLLDSGASLWNRVHLRMHELCVHALQTLLECALLGVVTVSRRQI